MKHHIFQENATYDVAILIKSSSFNKQEIYTTYVTSLEKHATCIAFTLKYENNKANATLIKEYCETLLNALSAIQIKYLYIADVNYFKYLVKVTKADPHIGYVLPCKIKGYEHIKCVLGINYQQLVFNPVLKDKVTAGLRALVSDIQGTYVPVGVGIIHSEAYPESTTQLAVALKSLHQYPRLTCDIEGFSLRHNEAGIGSISFAWDKNNGIAFEVDNLQTKKPKQSVRHLLRKFFESYKGELIFHYANYDIKAIVYALWMRNPLDYEGMLTGIDVLCKNVHDTKIIAYLAINSTAGNKLSLKELAQPFAGNYALTDIKDITLIEKTKLLQYNLVDALSTWYVFDTYYDVLVKDQQEAIYKDLMIPSLKVLIQTEMVGLPMDDTKIAVAKGILTNKRDDCLKKIMVSIPVKNTEKLIRQAELIKANAKLKTKQHTIDKYDGLVFNPNSGLQLQKLLYETLGLPVLDTTDTGQPATGGDVLKKLQHCCLPTDVELITALVEYSEADKILTTYIPNFESSFLKTDNRRYLHGSFNLGGTISGRLSATDGLQTLPSGSVYGKAVKSCFVAPEGWLFCFADFNALESRINALLTKDPNKLKVFTEGFDSHCLNAAAYFKKDMPEIDIDSVTSVNSIASKYGKLRQKSKTITFAAQYGGTYITFMNSGFSKEEALEIEKNYHELYKVSDDWTNKEIVECSVKGYATVAFGLRIRTPLLKQVIINTDSMPQAARAEARSVGNAISGQSYGMLNNRATNAFMSKVWGSTFRYSILPIAQVHDATYFIIKNDAKTIQWANTNLIKEMEWQALPEIMHKDVPLGANLDICKEGWHKPITLKNGLSKEEIETILLNL